MLAIKCGLAYILYAVAQFTSEARLGQIYRVAVVLETFTEHSRALVRGIANYRDQAGRGWELHSVPIGRSHGAMLAAAMHADGVITRPYLDEMVKVLQDSRKPTVAVHYFGQVPIPNVRSDATAIAKMATEHFVAQAFRHLAYFGPNRQFSLDRAAAFERLARRHRCSWNCYHGGIVEPEDANWYRSEPVLVKWLRDLPKPVGILAANDVMASQVLLAAPYAGVRVPDDAAVVGIDNDEMVCRLTTPRLSSIDYAGEKMGHTAAAMLDQLLHGKKLRKERVMIRPSRLVVRQSSDVLAVTDANVAAAVRFIRESTSRGLCVDDVLEEVPVARRTLELNFKKLLGRTIHEEIMESRVRKAKNLLMETELSIPQITEACGFCNRWHFSEVFKTNTGHAPAAFRRNYRTYR